MLELYHVLDQQVKRNNSVRLCKSEGCGTVLNPYNLSRYCYKCKRLRMIKGLHLSKYERVSKHVRMGGL